MANEAVPVVYAHGSKLARKRDSDAGLEPIVQAYRRWRDESLAVGARDEAGIHKLVGLLNTYKDTVEPVLDGRLNSAQEVLVSSILEEFFEYLFVNVDSAVGETLPVRYPEKGFLELAFHPKSIRSLVRSPEYTIKTKDHDFVLGGAATLSIQSKVSEAVTKEEIVIPAVALECKRYLERNMLDECAGTASRVKRATPYCLYVVVAEYLKMDESSPELTEIDEIYVLRKQRNSDRATTDFVPKPIDGGLVVDLYGMIIRHLRRIWWDPASALTTGKLFNF